MGCGCGGKTKAAVVTSAQLGLILDQQKAMPESAEINMQRATENANS